MLQEYEMYFRDEEGNKITDFYKFHAIITTYEIILSDLELLRSIEWRCIIIDEAHRLKNKNCSLIKSLRIFDCVSAKFVFRWIVMSEDTYNLDNENQWYLLISGVQIIRLADSTWVDEILTGYVC